MLFRSYVANGGESIVFYENWRENDGVKKWAEQGNGYTSWLNDPDSFDWTVWPELNDIRDYNIDDCESTLELVDWLREQQQAAGIQYAPEESEELDKALTEKQIDNQAKRKALLARQQALVDQFESSEKLTNDPIAELLVSLLHFYDRERKPLLWAYFERLEKTAEELYDDDTVVFDVELKETNYEDGKILFTGTYDKDQPVRTDKISTALIQGTESRVKNIKFFDVDAHRGEVSFVINAEEEIALQESQLSLFGEDARIDTGTLENRLCEITEDYFETEQLSGVIKTILNQGLPQFHSADSPLPVSRKRYSVDNEYMSAMIVMVKDLNESCLCIQGPPGAGKTYTADKVISELVRAGKRVGVMSNSHAAIMNLLDSVIKGLPNTDISKVGGFGSNQEKFKELYSAEPYKDFYYRTSMKFTNAKPYESFQIVGATAYSFAKDLPHESPLDYLFVDEASQVALANLIAVSGAAKNIILMGDQMQLEQPIQGSHPGQSGSSALEFMLKDHTVIPEDQGVFLERTYRMHPDVCKPLSEVVYEGKLKTDEDNKNLSVNIDNAKLVIKPNGILSIPVQHEGNTQSSEEEVSVIQTLIKELTTGTFTNKECETKPLTNDDILVVAPYNMQVNLLKEKLPDDIKVGTIDKFQGQEAPVVIISMAVSDVEDSSRGMDFVFDINRLNVAVSRAQALAIIVANEGLEQCQVKRLGQMEKVGFFVKLNNGRLNNE